MRYLLDTDHLSILQRQSGALSHETQHPQPFTNLDTQLFPPECESDRH
ncbi:hypothetical protein [[Phormidium] sp. ETS-05]|nr:hypothetical protein [[Phormidium] sp. ETS-05]